MAVRSQADQRRRSQCGLTLSTLGKGVSGGRSSALRSEQPKLSRKDLCGFRPQTRAPSSKPEDPHTHFFSISGLLPTVPAG